MSIDFYGCDGWHRALRDCEERSIVIPQWMRGALLAQVVARRVLLDRLERAIESSERLDPRPERVEGRESRVKGQKKARATR